MIQCSDGRKRALAALMALDDAGYSNIVGLKGGFNAWSLKFDNKLNRRMPIDGYKVLAGKPVYGYEMEAYGCIDLERTDTDLFCSLLRSRRL